MNGRRISLTVNSTHNNRMSSNPGTPSSSACGWIFALILCCLPGISLYDAAMKALTAESGPAASAVPLGIEHTPNTQVAISSHDSALTSSQRLLSQIQRAGNASFSSHADNTDPSDSLPAPGPLPSVCDLRAPVRGQGYDTGSLCLSTPVARTPYSPRSPPAHA